MAGLNKKLLAAVEAYFADLGRVRASGGATEERSYYPGASGPAGRSRGHAQAQGVLRA